jgi:hypothetical protein
MLLIFVVGVGWLWAKETRAHDRAGRSSNEIAPA